MSRKKRSPIQRVYEDWKEPLWGMVLSDMLVTGDILIGALELPRTQIYYFVIQSIQEDVLRLAILILGPTIGLFLRHFRIKREQLFRDLVQTLVHIVDHEIRNPLMIIMGASSLMKNTDPEDTKRLRQVSQGVDRIVEAVSNLGTMAHITSQRFYDIRDHLQKSTTPARDLKKWGTATTVVSLNEDPTDKKPEA
jgi:signal transduction histidine kinase